MKTAIRIGILTVIIFAVAWVANSAVHTALDGDLSLKGRIALEAAANISNLVSIAAAVTFLVCTTVIVTRRFRGLLDQLAAWLAALLGQAPAAAAEEPPVEIIDMAGEVSDRLGRLEERLSSIEGNQREATQRIRDVHVYTGQLVRLIAGTMRKSQQVARDAEMLRAALTALSIGDRVQIAEAAGRVNDGNIRTLLLESSRNGDDEFRGGVLGLVATQTGVLESSAQAFRGLSLDWMAHLTDCRAQTERLITVIDVYDAARPLLMIDEQLRTAQEYLSIDAQESPQLRQLPQVRLIAGR